MPMLLLKSLESLRERWNAPSELMQVVLYFLKLESTAFGGPAAHIALMHDEVVTRKKWLTEQEFLDLNSAANLIPGPNSTELAIHVGYRRAGWRGLLAAGISFILDAAPQAFGEDIIEGTAAAVHVDRDLPLQKPLQLLRTGKVTAWITIHKLRGRAGEGAFDRL